VLGLLPGAGYEQGALHLSPGDTVVLFSDGIPEALGPGGEEYGDARIAEVCRLHRDHPPAEIVTALLDSVQEFTRGEPQHDDITVVVVRYAPSRSTRSDLVL
jgi:sigma-B regulation protein RsbU (phosphoserine phosphatase)